MAYPFSVSVKKPVCTGFFNDWGQRQSRCGGQRGQSGKQMRHSWRRAGVDKQGDYRINQRPSERKASDGLVIPIQKNKLTK
jgi:hypothetical protein